ncbi:MAG: hypothetical protein ACOCP8_03060 [archaeon]
MIVNDNWIKRKISYLNSNIGIYKPTGKFYFEPTEKFYDILENSNFNSINYVIHDLCNFVECDFKPEFGGWFNKKDFIIKDDRTTDFGKNERVGYINSKSLIDSKIYLNFAYKGEPIILGAIIAHEITHHFLYQERLVKDNKEEEYEYFTDLAANFFGLGKLMLNGYAKNKYNIGYISHRNMAKINIRICKLRDIPIKKLKKNLSKDASRAVRRGYFNYKRKRRVRSLKKATHKVFNLLNIFKSKNDNKIEENNIDSKKRSNGKYDDVESIIITCGDCGQKMRLPKKNKTLKTNCPNCDREIIIGPKK